MLANWPMAVVWSWQPLSKIAVWPAARQAL